MIGFFSTRKVFRYAVMPEFMDRLKGLTSSGFQNVAYLLAVVYQMVRLLPANHPYLDSRNMGRFGIRHVIAEAANNLVISRKNIDQIILFVVILTGMIMLTLQICMLGASLFMGPLFAAPPPPDNWNTFFVVANPRQDIAYIMLDLVFGVRDPMAAAGAAIGSDSFFHSCVGYVGADPLDHCVDSWGVPIEDIDFSAITPAVPGLPLASQYAPLSSGSGAMFPFPIHWGMQALFGMYNLGLMMVGLIIASYFVVTVVAETAQSGTPFGKRFNKMWAPIRIVMAFGLLMPLVWSGGVSGMNSAQYIVLYAAKYGSAFATNGWNKFSTTLGTNYRVDAVNQLVSKPTVPEIEHISMFMWLVNVCYHLDEYMPPDPNFPGGVNAYIIGRQDRTVPGNTMVLSATTTLDQVLKDFLDAYPKFITIRFGKKNPQKYPKEDGNVFPTCGEIQIPITDSRHSGMNPLPSPGVATVQNFYFDLIKYLWLEDGNTSTFMPLNPYSVASTVHGGGLRSTAHAYHGENNIYLTGNEDPLKVDYVSTVNNTIRGMLKTAIDVAVAAQTSAGELSWSLGPCSNGPGSTLQNKGWGAAGMWYNCIAEMNGSLTSAVMAAPNPTRMPAVMESVASIKSKYDKNNSGPNMFQPVASGLGDIATQLNQDNTTKASTILYEAHRAWLAGQKTTQTAASDPFTAAISTFLGTNGLYDMRRNKDVHPLAQLVGIGRALVEAAVRKMGYAVGGALMARAMNGADGGLTGMAASMLVTIAMLGLTAGFVLFYIVPFLPFLYFFFALGGWVKAIFEAMVGAPLWALAHIRIDGHGLPGNAAMNGYFLIFEIFVRPILTVFGLLASVSIFAAMVSALNGIFDLVVYNVSGFDMDQELTGPAADSVAASMRGAIDEFFFTVMYAVIVYMMAMSSFKLIDQIPNNILRWMGQSVPTFGDTREDPAQALMGRVSSGSQQAFSKLGAGMGGVVGAISKPGK